MPGGDNTAPSLTPKHVINECAAGTSMVAITGNYTSPETRSSKVVEDLSSMDVITEPDVGSPGNLDSDGMIKIMPNMNKANNRVPDNMSEPNFHLHESVEIVEVDSSKYTNEIFNVMNSPGAANTNPNALSVNADANMDGAGDNDRLEDDVSTVVVSSVSGWDAVAFQQDLSQSTGESGISVAEGEVQAGGGSVHTCTQVNQAHSCAGVGLVALIPGFGSRAGAHTGTQVGGGRARSARAVEGGQSHGWGECCPRGNTYSFQ